MKKIIKTFFPLFRFIASFYFILCFCAFAYSQQTLNLDFEIRSPISTAFPWGWESNNTAKGLEGRLDSSTVHHGQYSLLMRSNGDISPQEIQSFDFDLEPLMLKGKTVTIEGWTRSENFQGSVTVILKTGGIDNRSVKTDSIRPQLKGTIGWTRFSFSARIPDRLQSLRLSIAHTGIGTVWIDDMAISVNNKKLNELQVALPFNADQMKWLNNSSFSLNGVDATISGASPELNDLAKFKEVVGDARIIALGEATHGTSEFFRMKHRVLEYAVLEMGVRVFAIEDHQLIVENVNRYVLGDTVPARKSMAGMFGIWDSQEVLNLIKWVRNYNDLHPDDKVEFTGFDMQGLSQPLDSLYLFLKRMDVVVYDSVSVLLSELKQNRYKTYAASDSEKLKWSNDAQRAFEIVFSNRQRWLSGSTNRHDSLRIEWGIQFARLVKQFARENIDPMALYRDEAMAENVTWLLSVRKPGTKILIWVHDVHISRGEHPQKILNYHAAKSMGSWLSKKYGRKYKAFGISTYSGAYRSYPGYSDYSRWISCPAYPGPVGSLDHALHMIAQQRKKPALFLDLTNARKQKWLSAPLPVRFANHVCYEYAYWTRYSIPYQFDGIFFIDETSPAR